jgi:NNP family nitrate/nitrite transporter-like MFS transporter
VSRWIADYNPEDLTFWETRGRFIARRNLIGSIFAENIGFSVWMLWSATTAQLKHAGFTYTTDQLFLLVALPGLVGALMRFPYTFAVPKFGGRNWTIVSALLLLIPTTLLACLVSRPDTPFWLMAIAASTAGLGGGNFASSMANISFFYPDRSKGLVLGLNAAGGNLGVSTVQVVVPILATAGVALCWAGIVWMPLIAMAALGAFFFMDNLASAKSSFGAQIAAAKHGHTWVMSWLYVGTFGSFIGFSAAFPLLAKTQFPESSMNLAFVGPLVGSAARPIGGWLADKLTGARVTLCAFIVMTLATVLLIHAIHVHSFSQFILAFFTLLVASGAGNGSTYRMIPALIRRAKLDAAKGHGEDAIAIALTASRTESAAVLGLTSAVGALGGFLIPRAFGASLASTGGPGAALSAFIAFYATCFALTWWCYSRKRFLVRLAPSLLEADPNAQADRGARSSLPSRSPESETS